VYTKIDTATGLATTGITWAALVNPLTTPAATNFNAVNYDSYRGKYLSVGTGGKIIAMTPSSSTTWTELTYYTGGQNLFAIANNSGGITVVTGATGTILTSSDGGSTWAYPNSNTTNALNGVAYGYVTASAVYRFVAVGASGTVRYSTDGVTWATDASVPITSEIKGVTYGLVASVGTFVAVTADGKVITSPDGKTWTLTTASAISTSALNAVTASANVITPAPLLTTATNTNVFVTVDNAGNIFRSVNGGVTWSSVNTGSGSPLYAIIRGGLYDYATVGSAGLNLYAD
jgi:photosystem II stability/assembly factor-like uncharacterized protein